MSVKTKIGVLVFCVFSYLFQAAETWTFKVMYKKSQTYWLLDVRLPTFESSDDSMVRDNRQQGRPPRRWTDEINEWCNYTLPEAVRLAEADKYGKRSTTTLVSTELQGHKITRKNVTKYS